MGTTIGRGDRTGTSTTSDRRWAPAAEPAGRWFASLWSAAVLFHLAANGSHLLRLDGIGVAQLVMVLPAIRLLFVPAARAAAGLAAAYLVVFWWKLPVVGNHEVVLALVALSALISVASARPAERTHWTASVAPAGRWILLVSYGFMAFSKLNRGFFDTVESCAVLFATDLGHTFGVDAPTVARAAPLLIVATAAIELSIPILLAWPFTRSIGVILAMGFHFVLALDPVAHVWDFSSTLLPLFLLFMPAPFFDDLDRWARRPGRVPAGADERRRSARLGLGLIVAAQALAMAGGGPLPTWIVAYPLWLVLSATLLVAAMVFERRSGRQAPTGAAVVGSSGLVGRAVPRPALLSVVALALLVGLGPYGEWRSAAAFNMYSNLQIVDGRSNHLLVGSLRRDDRRLVEIIEADPDSDLAYYVGSGLLVPEENLARHLRRKPTGIVAVRVEPGIRPDRPIEHTRAGQLALGGGRVIDQLRHKLAFRRAIDGTGADRCLRAWGPVG